MKNQIKTEEAIFTRENVAEILFSAMNKTEETAVKNANDFIKNNPAHKTERIRQLELETSGIWSLYVELLDRFADAYENKEYNID